MSFSGAAIAPPPSILEEPPVKRDGNYTLSYDLGLYIYVPPAEGRGDILLLVWIAFAAVSA